MHRGGTVRGLAGDQLIAVVQRDVAQAGAEASLVVTGMV